MTDNVNLMKLVDIKDYTRYMGLSMLQKGLTVSPLKLQKLLYYQQAWHMVYFGRENTLFADAPQAWVNGPVYPVIFQEYKDKVAGMCEHLHIEDFTYEKKQHESTLKELNEKMTLVSDELALTDRVITLYGSKTLDQLVLLTHSEKPWSEQRIGLLPYARSDKEISLDTMYTYYKQRYDRNRA